MRGPRACVAILGALLAVTGCASSGSGLASPTTWWSCSSLPQYDDLIRTIADTALDVGVLRVPVVVHLMDRHNKSVVKDIWGTPQGFDHLRTYFAPAAANFSVNAVWAKAGIRLDLERVEHCQYPESFLSDDPRGPALQMPDPPTMRNEPPDAQQARIERYLTINQMYGHPGRLNLFFWERLSQDVHGYGESPRRNRIEVVERRLDAVPAAWYSVGDRNCQAPGRRLGCQMFLAHEIGHALGLKHVCRACTGSTVESERAEPHCCTRACWAPRDHYAYESQLPSAALCFTPPADGAGRCCCGCEPGELARDGINACGRPVVCCGTGLSSLMQIEASLTKTGTLCEGEIHSARSAVRDFFPTRAGGRDGKRTTGR